MKSIYSIASAILVPIVLVLFLTGFDKSTSLQLNPYSISDSSGCDQGFWERVYSPSRLKVINKCISATGVITQSAPNEDGIIICC